MEGFQTFTVGQPFRFRDAETCLRNCEAFLLEWDRSGYMLIVALPGMTPGEVDIIKRNLVCVSALVEGACVLPIWRFSGSALFGETPFDPTKYRKWIPEFPSLLPKSNLVTVMGVDSATMIVKVLRAANLPKTFVAKAVNAWQRAWDDPSYSARYSQWIDSLMLRSLDDISARAEYMGRLGDA